ncbi:MAG: Eco57I restriction-modification methylase domain-containing protein [Prevotella sp.]
MNSLIKNSGQVFTPKFLVNFILDEIGYQGCAILNKHCIDNSCGDGAFLCEIISRYIKAYRTKYGNVDDVAHDISKYIHGIEIDPITYNNCINNLKSICNEYEINCEQFDIIKGDTLSTIMFDGKMDYVIGNPPYVRVHNLEKSYNSVKTFSFAKDGMTDLYLVFFEKGFRMLKDHGKLCYITPSSWLNSVAGNVMRNYIRRNHNLLSLIDLEHFQAFNATTYTIISMFEKGVRNNTFAYNVFSPQLLNKKYIASLSFNEIDINSCFYLSDHTTLSSLRQILSAKVPKYVKVKNGFATLADKIFISSDFPFSELIIPVIKASTGKWYKAFYPYDKKGKPLSTKTIFSIPDVVNYLNSHKQKLLKFKQESTTPFWYLYGRTQALKDVCLNKLSINTTIKDIKSLKLNFVPAGSGLYSGLYIISNIDFDIIKQIILTDNFINYIASLKKYKSGGYYTYNSKDLESYLNYEINKLVDNGIIQISSIEQCRFFACNI